MAENKVQATDADVTVFLKAVEHPVRLADGLTVHRRFREIIGSKPGMCGPSILGYGQYHYE
jgi:hypothetical protein